MMGLSGQFVTASMKNLTITNATERFLTNPQSDDTLTVTYRAEDFTDGDGA